MVKDRDIMFLTLSSAVLFMLRTKELYLIDSEESLTLKLVGECYVHSIMKDEIISNSRGITFVMLV